MFLCGREGLGSVLFFRKFLLFSSCRMVRLVSCFMSLKVSLMLRNMEKKSFWFRVSTRMFSGKSRVVFFFSRVIFIYCIIRFIGYSWG